MWVVIGLTSQGVNNGGDINLARSVQRGLLIFQFIRVLFFWMLEFRFLVKFFVRFVDKKLDIRRVHDLDHDLQIFVRLFHGFVDENRFRVKHLIRVFLVRRAHDHRLISHCDVGPMQVL